MSGLRRGWRALEASVEVHPGHSGRISIIIVVGIAAAPAPRLARPLLSQTAVGALGFGARPFR